MKAILMLAVTAMVACSKQESLTPHLHTQEKVLTTLSLPVQHHGITRLEQVSRAGNAVSYRYSGKVSGVFTYTQLEKSKIELRVASVTLVLNKRTAIFVERGVDLFTHPALTTDQQTNIALAMHLYNELVSPEIPRTPVGAIPLNSAPCMDMMISYLYYTRSGAEFNVNAAVDRFLALNSPYCSRKYGVDEACLWEDYGCIATQSIECCSAPL